MILSDDNKAELLKFIDSHLFLGCCKLVADKAAEKVDTDRCAADLGLLMAIEKGVNQFPALLRELAATSTEPLGPPQPRSLRPATKPLR